MKERRFFRRRTVAIFLTITVFLVTELWAQGLFRRRFMVWPATPALVTRTTGNITFGPETVADMQRTESEPLNFIDRNGATWATGPWGVSTGNSFIQRSADNGDQYN